MANTTISKNISIKGNVTVSASIFKPPVWYESAVDIDMNTSVTAGSVGNYALFAGGGVYHTGTWNKVETTVHAVNTSKEHTTPTALQKGRYDMATCNIGKYVLFAGGASKDYDTNAVTYYANVDAYNESLVRSSPSNLSLARSFYYLPRNRQININFPYALFPGDETKNAMDAYNSNLVRSTPSNLSTAKNNVSIASIGNNALFAGGHTTTGNHEERYHTSVDSYNSNLVRSTITPLSEGRYKINGHSLGNYALFIGGIRLQDASTGNGTGSRVIDLYNTSLTKLTPLSWAYSTISGFSFTIGNNAVLKINSNLWFTIDSNLLSHVWNAFSENSLSEDEIYTVINDSKFVIYIWAKDKLYFFEKNI